MLRVPTWAPACLCVVIAAFAFASVTAKDEDAPLFLPSVYEVNISYHMPYIGLVEPVHVVMDDPAGLQRLGFYDGMDLYYFNKSGFVDPDDPTSKQTDFEILPVIDHKECFAHPQKGHRTILPDVSSFVKIEGEYEVDGQSGFSKWILDQPTLNMTSTNIGIYHIYADAKTGLIRRYNFLGHNSVFGGSHTDEYLIDYKDWVINDIDYTWFKLPKGFTQKSCALKTPTSEMKEYRDPREDLVSMFPESLHRTVEAFEAYKKTYDKTYTDSDEHAKRHLEFHWNLRFIHSHNRKGKSFWLGVNHLMDMTRDELKAMSQGRLKDAVPDETHKYADQVHVPSMRERELPESVNWTASGAVTRVKDQGSCGSCWSFGTTGTIEGQMFRKTGRLVRLSQQELMDCSWKYKNKACNGGTDSRSYRWMINTTGGTIATEDSYGPYLNAAGWCHWDKAERSSKITGYVAVPRGDMLAFNDAIANVGPLSVSVDATNPTFYYYAGGLYDDVTCGQSADHIVLVTGYATVNGQRYTLVKNSWSTHWGKEGYILVTQKENACGLANEATYPIMAEDQPGEIIASADRVLGLKSEGKTNINVRKMLE